ncbi:Os03g0128250 [Oryza sativa Japonica Group]|uniref:Os03g0128250 protein n=1 Tax=Oryza sativa subsp. japonica TaxID=39947 RepID=A0A0P0VSJ3_ORYSJ|nr:Os03g0128250 [Oryza sativa Japonica Group]
MPGISKISESSEYEHAELRNLTAQETNLLEQRGGSRGGDDYLPPRPPRLQNAKPQPTSRITPVSQTWRHFLAVAGASQRSFQKTPETFCKKVIKRRISLVPRPKGQWASNRRDNSEKARTF